MTLLGAMNAHSMSFFGALNPKIMVLVEALQPKTSVFLCRNNSEKQNCALFGNGFGSNL